MYDFNGYIFNALTHTYIHGCVCVSVSSYVVNYYYYYYYYYYLFVFFYFKIVSESMKSSGHDGKWAYYGR